MIDVKEATQQALSYFEELYGQDAFSNVLLEEVERTEENGTPYWFVTIGFTHEEARREEEQQDPLGVFTSSGPRRRYKRFKIDGETGEVVSMKIRSVGNA